MQVNYDVFTEIVRYLSLVDVSNYEKIYPGDVNVMKLKNNFHNRYSYIQDLIKNSQQTNLRANLHILLTLLNDKELLHSIIQNSTWKSITQRIEDNSEYYIHSNDEVVKLFVEKQMKLKCKLEGHIWIFNATLTTLANRFLGLTCDFLEGGNDLQRHLLEITSRHLLTEKSVIYIDKLSKLFLLKKPLHAYKEVIQRLNDVNWHFITPLNPDIEIVCGSSHGLKLLLDVGFVAEETPIDGYYDLSSVRIYVSNESDKNTVKSALDKPWHGGRLSIECKDIHSLPLVFDFVLATGCFDLDKLSYRSSCSSGIYNFMSSDYEVVLHLHLKNHKDEECTLHELMKEYDYGRE